MYLGLITLNLFMHLMVVHVLEGNTKEQQIENKLQKLLKQLKKQ